MDRLQALKTFREVARQGGFAAAARALNTSPPSVSRLISELEDDLGVRLFSRSTRSVALTEEGELLLRRAIPLAEEFELVTQEIRERQSKPQGHLRISSVVAFGQERIAPLLPAFMEQHPSVTVELDISNRKVDLVQEHVDLAIRIGGPEGLDTSSLVARRIFSQRLIFVAAPAYIARRGEPETLDDLRSHRIVKQISGNWGRKNQFVTSDGLVDLALPEDLVVNSPNAARNAVLSGHTMALLADYLAADMLADGRLSRLLPDVTTAEQPIYAVFVHRQYMPAKIRAFLDFAVENL